MQSPCKNQGLFNLRGGAVSDDKEKGWVGNIKKNPDAWSGEGWKLTKPKRENPPDPRNKTGVEKTRCSFSMELFEEICARVAEGESVSKICMEANMPSRFAFYSWLKDESKPECVQMYNEALHLREELLFDETKDIVDDPEAGYDKVSVAHATLRFNARRWILSRMNPKRYGDKLSQEITGGDGKPLQTSGNVIFNVIGVEPEHDDE